MYVQGLGRFEAIFHPAVLDVTNATVKPPHAEGGFSPGIENSNNLLAAFIHYVTGMNETDAMALIDAFAMQVQRSIAEGNKYTIEKFGTFSRSHGDHIHFTPDWDAFNLSFRGLETIELTPQLPKSGDSETEVISNLAEFPPPPVSEILTGLPFNEPVSGQTESLPVIDSFTGIEELKPAEPVIADSTSRLWWMILATALFLITVLCAYLAWDIFTNKKKLDHITSVEDGSSVTGNMDDVVTVPDTTIVNEDIIYRDSIQDIVPDTITQAPPEVVDPPCLIVVGAFANPQNVDRMIERLQSLDYEYDLIKGGNLTRVAIKTSCEKNSLQDMLNTARSSINPEAWIY